MNSATLEVIEKFFYAFGDSQHGGFFQLVQNQSDSHFAHFSLPAFAESLQLDVEHLAKDAQVFYSRIAQDELRGLKRALEKSAKTQVFFNHTFQFSLPAQANRVLSLHALASINADNQIVWTGLCQDVTTLVEQGEQLKISSTIINNISQGIIFGDADNKLFKCNPAFTKITGYEEHEAIGRNCKFLQNERTDPHVIDEIRQCLKNNKEFHGVILNQRKDGTEFWNELTITPVFNENEHLIYSVGMIKDVTESKRLSDALAKTQSLMQATNDKFVDLYEFAPIGYLSLNHAGTVIDANWKARSILSIKRKSLGEVRFNQFLSDEDKRYWINQFNALLASAIGQESELELKIQQGTEHIDVNLVCVRMESQQANDALVRITIRDVTAVKETQRQLVQKEGYQRSLIDNFPFMVWLKDREGRFLTVNKTFAESTGFNQPDALIGKSDYDCWPYDLAQTYLKDDKMVMDTAFAKSVEELIELKGERLWFETYKAPVFVNNQVIGTVGYAQDITEKKRAVEYEKFRVSMLELVVREQNTRVILDTIAKGIEDLNPTVFCVIALYNEGEERIYHLSTPSIPVSFLNALTNLKVVMGNGSIGTALYSKQRVIVDNIQTHPFWEAHKEGALKAGIHAGWAEPILGAHGQVLGAVGIYHQKPQKPSTYDIHLIEQTARLISIALERNQSFSRIQSLAYRDTVTGLPNRRYVNELIHQVADNSQLKKPQSRNSKSQNLKRKDLQPKSHIGLIYIDIDHFKLVNDGHGHDIGNALLVEISKRLQKPIDTNILASLGGDEFLVLMTGLSQDLSEAESLVSKLAINIKKQFAKPFNIHRSQLHITASIGVAVVDDQSANEEDCIKLADIAMFHAKKAGRNQIRYFDPAMQQSIATQLAIEAELREAIKLDQFKLFYQVQVDHLGQAFGAEALIRWIHPKRGMVSPAQFIPVAEETGLIIPMGIWVLETACAQIAAWQQDQHTKQLTLSVNISAKQFRQADFVKTVKACIDKYKIDPNALRLELTESILLENIDDAVKSMNELGTIGVQFSLDDFGTGYSSLQYLKMLPLYQLKIDQSFVRDIVEDSHDRTIVRTIIAMAQSMYLSVIAEGVETEAQKELLLTSGCRRYQGYFFGKPVPIEQFNQALQTVTTTNDAGKVST